MDITTTFFLKDKTQISKSNVSFYRIIFPYIHMKKYKKKTREKNRKPTIGFLDHDLRP